jgi:hypothetical protein
MYASDFHQHLLDKVSTFYIHFSCDGTSGSVCNSIPLKIGTLDPSRLKQVITEEERVTAVMSHK